MNAWLLTATVLLFSLIPCGIVTFRGRAIDRLIGLEMTGIITTIILLLLAEGYKNPNFYDLALATGLLAFGGSMVFVRFLERWL
jgi:multisubunit Na+/H+ antiporter MnhF subunit